MKTTAGLMVVLVVACWVMGLAGCCSMSKPMDMDNLQKRENPQGVSLMYAPNEDKPFTGRAVLLYEDEDWDGDGGRDEDAQVQIEGNLKDGVPHGRWTHWFENGQKELEGEFQDGEEVGTFVGWYENGQKKAEGDFQDGEKAGTWTWWNEDGTVNRTEVF